MKKEVFLAIILGFGIGLIITFGIYTAQKAVQQKTTPQSQDLSPSPTPDIDISTQSLHITAPENESISTEDTTTITGTTSPTAQVAILTDADQYLTIADDQGNFSQTIDLTPGANFISITTIDADGNQVDQNLIITYTTVDLNSEPAASNSATTKEGL